MKSPRLATALTVGSRAKVRDKTGQVWNATIRSKKEEDGQPFFRVNFDGNKQASISAWMGLDKFVEVISDDKSGDEDIEMKEPAETTQPKTGASGKKWLCGYGCITKDPPPKPAIPRGKSEVTVPCPEIGEGWTQHLVVRKGGNGNNQADRFFFSPEGTRFFSFLAVKRYLNGEHPKEKEDLGTNTLPVEKEATEGTPASLRTKEPKYAVGTAVSKRFYVGVGLSSRHFSGKVKGYNADKEMYTIMYSEDEYEEEIGEEELSHIALRVGNDGRMDECFICADGGELILCDREGCNKAYHASCVDVDVDTLPSTWHCPTCRSSSELTDNNYAVGTVVSKVFYDEAVGEDRPYRGEVAGYNPFKKVYMILYEDGDDEELEEWQLSKIVLGNGNKDNNAATATSVATGSEIYGGLDLSGVPEQPLIRSGFNASGYRGINKGRDKYRARINIEGNKVILGTFDTLEEAAGIYARASYYLEQNGKRDKAKAAGWQTREIWQREANVETGCGSKRSHSSDEDEEDDWESVFKELCTYKRQLGHANPKRTVPYLGEWAHQMRMLYMKNSSGEMTSLTDERIAKLEGVGFRFIAVDEDMTVSNPEEEDPSSRRSKRRKIEEGGMAKEQTTTFQIGDRIEARYRGRGKRYYPGVIVNVDSNGRYDVDYNDSDKDRGLSGHFIRRLSGQFEMEDVLVSSEEDRSFSNKATRRKGNPNPGATWPCSFEGCNQWSVRGGVCMSHGAEIKICSHEGCTTKVLGGGVCVDHGAKNNICSRAGCTNNRWSGMACAIHGGRRFCSHGDCTNFTKVGRFCQGHATASKRARADKGNEEFREEEDEEQHNDLCETCGKDGVVICCSTCNLVFHLGCTRPKLIEVPNDDWCCAFCVASGVDTDASEEEQRQAQLAKQEIEALKEEFKTKKKSPDASTGASFMLQSNGGGDGDNVEMEDSSNVIQGKIEETPRSSVKSIAELSRPPPRPKIPTGKAEVTASCPEIGEGWTQQVVARRPGGGSADRFYFSPEGMKFFSFLEVKRYLNGEGWFGPFNNTFNNPLIGATIYVASGHFIGLRGTLTAIAQRGWWTIDNPQILRKVQCSSCKIVDDGKADIDAIKKQYAKNLSRMPQIVKPGHEREGEKEFHKEHNPSKLSSVDVERKLNDSASDMEVEEAKHTPQRSAKKRVNYAEICNKLDDTEFEEDSVEEISDDDISSSTNPKETKHSYVGVIYRKGPQKYQSFLAHNRKWVHLGNFTLGADAALAHDEACRLLKLSEKANFATIEDYKNAKHREQEQTGLGMDKAVSSAAIASKVNKIISQNYDVDDEGLSDDDSDATDDFAINKEIFLGGGHAESVTGNDNSIKHQLLLKAKERPSANERAEYWYPEIDIDSGSVNCKRGKDYPTYMLDEPEDYLFNSQEKCLEKWGKKMAPTDEGAKAKSTTATTDTTTNSATTGQEVRHDEGPARDGDSGALATSKTQGGHNNQAAKPIDLTANSNNPSNTSVANSPPSASTLPRFGQVSNLGSVAPNIAPVALQNLDNDAQTTSHLASQLQHLTGNGNLSQIKSRPTAAASSSVLGNWSSISNGEIMGMLHKLHQPQRRSQPDSNKAISLSDAQIRERLHQLQQKQQGGNGQFDDAREEHPTASNHNHQQRASASHPRNLSNVGHMSDAQLREMLNQLKQPERPTAPNHNQQQQPIASNSNNVSQMSDSQIRELLQKLQPQQRLSASNSNNVSQMSDSQIRGMLQKLQPQQRLSASAPRPLTPNHNQQQSQLPSVSNPHVVPHVVSNMSDTRIRAMLHQLKPQRPSAINHRNQTQMTVAPNHNRNQPQMSLAPNHHNQQQRSPSVSSPHVSHMSTEQIREMLNKLKHQH